jgi:putative GTP pyrophosphokinase
MAFYIKQQSQDINEKYSELTENDKNLLNEYFKIEKFYRYALKEMQAKIENLDDYCENSFSHNPIHHIESRIKTPENIIEKLHRRSYPITMNSIKEYLYDIAGMRVVCNYINDIYQIIDLLSKHKDIQIRFIKDYIENPKSSGYRSVHVICDIDIYVVGAVRVIPIEIQFRTIAMDMWASLEHELRYKSKNTYSEEEKANLKKYSDELYAVDLNMQKLFLKKTEGDIEND